MLWPYRNMDAAQVSWLRVAWLSRSLQNEPYPAVFHDRLKLSTGGRRIKLDQKFQLLAPGVLPVKYYSIWHRVS